jgi:hypothetical protein
MWQLLINRDGAATSCVDKHELFVRIHTNNCSPTGDGDFSATLALTARGPGQKDGPVGARREQLAPLRDGQLQSARFLMTGPTRTSAHCNRTRTDPMEGAGQPSDERSSRDSVDGVHADFRSTRPGSAHKSRSLEETQQVRATLAPVRTSSANSRLKCMGCAMNVMRFELPSAVPSSAILQNCARVLADEHARDGKPAVLSREFGGSTIAKNIHSAREHVFCARPCLVAPLCVDTFSRTQSVSV